MTKARHLIASAATALGLALLTAPAPVLAGDIVDAATAVEAALQANDFDAWQAANAALLDKLWNAPGLHFGTLVLTQSEPTGYGAYVQRADNVYAQGEPILIYAEPMGYGFGALDDGRNEIAFDIDLKVLGTDGEVLADAPGIMNLAYASHGTPHEFMANITYNLDGIPPGTYTLDTTFRDRHAEQSASFTNEIVIK